MMGLRRHPARHFSSICILRHPKSSLEVQNLHKTPATTTSTMYKYYKFNGSISLFLSFFLSYLLQPHSPLKLCIRTDLDLDLHLDLHLPLPLSPLPGRSCGVTFTKKSLLLHFFCFCFYLPFSPISGAFRDDGINGCLGDKGSPETVSSFTGGECVQ